MAISEKNIKLIFGLKLHQYRMERQYSLSQLSKKSNISISYLNEMEKGKKYPKTDKILSISEALQVDYDQLISLQLGKELAPVSELIRSNMLNELPLEFFGIEPANILQLLSRAPTKLSAFVNSIIQIGRTYDIRFEHFFFSVLRSYQEIHDNYFEDIEKLAKNFIHDFNIDFKGLDRADQFADILSTEYGYQIEYKGLDAYPELKSLRYLLIPDDNPRLLLNSSISKAQLLFILGKEIGYNIMNLKDRSYTSSWVESKKFDHVLNNFKSYYFSSAIILHEKKFVKGLLEFSTNEKFNPDRLIDLMESYNSNAEMFMLRISNLIPRYFRFFEMFLFRYNHDLNNDTFYFTKDFQSSGMQKPYSLLSDVKSCKRWSGISILQELASLQANNNYHRPICKINRVKYIHSKKEYLIISVANPMHPTPNMNCSVSVGFKINQRFLSRTKFLNDPQIPFKEVDFEWVKKSSAYCDDDLEKPSVMMREVKISKLRNSVHEILYNNLKTI